MMTDIERLNDMIERANAFTDELTDAGIRWSARMMAQGVEVEIVRPTWGGESASYRIITPR